MAYLSTVAIAMRKTDYERMYQRASSLCSNEDNNIYTAFLEEGKKNCAHRKCLNGDYLFLCWNWIKWFSLEGEFVDDFLKEIEDYDFVKVGEDVCDVYIDIKTEEMFLDVSHEICFSEE